MGREARWQMPTLVCRMIVDASIRSAAAVQRDRPRLPYAVFPHGIVPSTQHDCATRHGLAVAMAMMCW